MRDDKSSTKKRHGDDQSEKFQKQNQISSIEEEKPAILGGR
jgi:hypothetical protein